VLEDVVAWVSKPLVYCNNTRRHNTDDRDFNVHIRFFSMPSLPVTTGVIILMLEIPDPLPYFVPSMLKCPM